MSHTTDKKTEEMPKPDKSVEVSLKGTFASVMLLGAILLLVWVSVFVLFIERS